MWLLVAPSATLPVIYTCLTTSALTASEEQRCHQLLDDPVKAQMENEGVTTLACHIKKYNMLQLALQWMMEKCTF